MLAPLLFGTTLGRQGFVSTEGNRFVLNGQEFFVFSANYWTAMNLGAVSSAMGNRTRLLRDLDALKNMGVNNLRIMASSEGPNGEPYRMNPALMNSPGEYNEDILDGLDFAMSEIGKRGMKAVLCLNNRWEWSGGFAQYVSWATNNSIPYPPAWSKELQNYTEPPVAHSWGEYTTMSDSFYQNQKIRQIVTPWYKNHLKKIITRKNRYTGLLYKDDPAVFSWQLANEPGSPSADWVEEMAGFIKRLDPDHMVVVGLESNRDEQNFDESCAGASKGGLSSKNIDYLTNHIWVQNSHEYDMMDPSKTNIAHAIDWGLDWVEKAHSWALKHGKPLVLEEFGLARDNWVANDKSTARDVYNHMNPTTNRDRYYEALLMRVVELHNKGGAYAGFGFWAYAGEARPGDLWLGDPPHEAPGWYSVYDKDYSTLSIMQNAYSNVIRNKSKK